MTDEAARLAARFEEYANDPASVSIPSRQECLDASAILRAIPPIGTQAPVAWRWQTQYGLADEWEYTRYKPGVDYRVLEPLYASPPALVAQREALAGLLAYEKEKARLNGFSDCTCMGHSRAAEKAYETGKCPHQIALALLNATPATGGETEREYDSNIEPCNDAEFGMKP